MVKKSKNPEPKYLGKTQARSLCPLSVPVSSSESENNNKVYHIRLGSRVNELIHVKPIEWCMAQSKHYISVSFDHHLLSNLCPPWTCL